MCNHCVHRSGVSLSPCCLTGSQRCQDADDIHAHTTGTEQRWLPSMSDAQVTHTDPARECPANWAWHTGDPAEPDTTQKYFHCVSFMCICIVFRTCNMTLRLQYFIVSSITHLRNILLLHTFRTLCKRHHVCALNVVVPSPPWEELSSHWCPRCQTAIHQLVRSLCKQCNAQIDGQCPLPLFFSDHLCWKIPKFS